jgi:tRNA-Thr(GGU) m(6)t(6)A37 methyltransferase TsaA
MDDIIYKPIGIIHTSYRDRQGTPRQAIGASKQHGIIEVFYNFYEGLDDLHEYSHLLVLFHMHMLESFQMKVFPSWTNKPRGVFSSVAPHRPNPIGVSVVNIDDIKENEIYISGVDMVDGSPVLDIKPYIPNLFPKENIKLGWYDGHIETMLNSHTGDK